MAKNVHMFGLLFFNSLTAFPVPRRKGWVFLIHLSLHFLGSVNNKTTLLMYTTGEKQYILIIKNIETVP